MLDDNSVRARRPAARRWVLPAGVDSTGFPDITKNQNRKKNTEMTDNDEPVDCRRCNRDNAEQNSSRHNYHDDHQTGEQEQKNDETTEVN